MSVVRVRFAPSPTGFLHLGGFRTALYNYLFAKRNKGKFILRIEDTDQQRKVPGAVDNLIKTLAWGGIHPDEGPHIGGSCGSYIQSERLHLYNSAVKKLIDEKLAYRCFCSPEKLAQMRQEKVDKGERFFYDRTCHSLNESTINDLLAQNKPYTVRMLIPSGEIIVDDLVFGKMNFNYNDLEDFIIMKSDGFPTYHLANVVDDSQMQVSHVIRGEEWISSIPKHILLYNQLKLVPPKFSHLPLLVNIDDRSKLSKRQAHASVQYYIDKGFLPEAIINFVSLLGWTPESTNQEIFTIDELIELFSLERVHKYASAVNINKLIWFNSMHLRNFIDNDLNKVIELVWEKIPEEWKNKTNKEFIGKVIKAMKERLELHSDFNEKCRYFFEPPVIVQHVVESDLKMISLECKQTNLTFLVGKDVLKCFAKFNDFYLVKDDNTNLTTWESFFSTLKQFCKSEKIPVKDMTMLLRVALTGDDKGCQLNDVFAILGFSECYNRISSFFLK